MPKQLHGCFKSVKLTDCTDCDELENRMVQVEECCQDAHEDIDDLDNQINGLDNTKASIEYVNDSVGGVNNDVQALSATFSNFVLETSCTRNLWTGETGDLNALLNLSDDISNYNFIDFYYIMVGVHNSWQYIRVPAIYLSNHTVYLLGTFHVGGQIYNDEIAIVKMSNTQLKINANEYWNWNGDHTQDATYNNTESFGKLVRIDGVKVIPSGSQSPALPTTAGDYKMQVTVNNGVPSYAWVLIGA